MENQTYKALIIVKKLQFEKKKHVYGFYEYFASLKIKLAFDAEKKSQFRAKANVQTCNVTRPSFLWSKDLIRQKNLLRREHSARP